MPIRWLASRRRDGGAASRSIQTARRITPRAQIAVLILLIFLGTGCHHEGLQHSSSLRVLSRGLDPTLLLADYQPWFGDPNHIDVGYNSQDPKVLRKQIAEARARGIHAFVVDWYGPRQPFLDRSYALLQHIAQQEHFRVALMYDETQEDNGHATEDALEAMDLAYEKYIGPGAKARDAYLTYQGRPVLFVFPKRGNTNWNIVRERVNAWQVPPILIYKDDPPPEYAQAFDGQYPWVFPGKQGWKPDGQAWGEDYLNDFYIKMRTKYPDQITVGGLWPGFDDSRASWGLNRKIDARCGQTFEDTWAVFRAHNDPCRPIPFLLIATWNDYEEGTAIEPGLSPCSADSSGTATGRIRP